MASSERHAFVGFALVNVPVRVVKVTKGETTKQTPTKLLHGKCWTPLKQPKVCPECNVQVGPGDIVHGVKKGGGYVPVDVTTDKPGEQSQVLRIEKFTRQVFEATRTQAAYWLLPETKTTQQELAYAVLCDAMSEKQVTGFGHCSLWSAKEHPMLIESYGGVLLMRLLHHDEDMVKPESLGMSPNALVVPKQNEMLMARQLVEAFTALVEPVEITTEARAWREQQIRDQALRDIVEVAPLPPDRETVDVLDTLKRSVALIEKNKAAKAAKKPAGKRAKAPTR